MGYSKVIQKVTTAVSVGALSLLICSPFAFAEEKTELDYKKEQQAKEQQDKSKDEKVEVETPASVTGEKVQGQATVTDFTTSGSKAFYTITDKESKVYHLIIDMDKTENNVYFLSDVNKADIENGNVNATAGVPPTTAPNTADVTPNTQEPVQNTDSATKTESSGDSGFLIFIGAIGIAIVAGYYFLVIRKKKKNTDQEDNEEENFEDDFLSDDKNTTETEIEEGHTKL